MILAFLLYPIMHCWYIALPETLYMLYAGLRSVAHDDLGELYLMGFVIYDIAFINNETGTMAVTAVLIAVDICFHRGKTIRNAPIGGISGSGKADRYDPVVCPYCGSSDIDGNHCYTCGEDF